MAIYSNNQLLHSFEGECRVTNVELDDVIKWKLFRRYWSFVRGIHRSPVNYPHKGQWRGALMFSLIYAWINCWVNNCEAGDSRRHRAHYDVIVMKNTDRVPPATTLLLLPPKHCQRHVGILQWTWNENAMYLCQENPFKMSSAFNGLYVLDTFVQSNKPINTLRPRQNVGHFADDIFLNENVCISFKISLKIVSTVPIYIGSQYQFR